MRWRILIGLARGFEAIGAWAFRRARDCRAFAASRIFALRGGDDDDV